MCTKMSIAFVMIFSCVNYLGKRGRIMICKKCGFKAEGNERLCSNCLEALISKLQDKDSLIRKDSEEELAKICETHVYLKEKILSEIQLMVRGDLTDVAATGRPEIAKLLIKAGADVNTRTRGGYTPLLIAAARGRTDVVQALLDAGADLDAIGEDGIIAEHKAYHNSKLTDLNEHYIETYKILVQARTRASAKKNILESCITRIFTNWGKG